MSGRIPQEFINDLLLRVDIVELINNRVPLKKQGANFVACCPFHSEKTPSFSVNQNKQFYHCFGCGASGNAIRFLMEFERLEFVEAVEDLARLAGVSVERIETVTQYSKPKISQSLYDLMSSAADFYEQQLRSPKAVNAISYLKNRGIDGRTCQHFRIGFVDDDWDNLKKHLTKKGYSISQMLECGLLVQKNKSAYDRFRGRLMFPILDKRNRVIAFGGRVIGKGEPKYLNSPETPIFHKGDELYGFHHVNQLRTLLEVIVVEGYMDVVALAQFGIPYCVATLGTATSAKHIQTLFRRTDRIIFCFDGDRAGREAAWKALEVSLPHIRGEKEVKFLFLEEGEDPDSTVREHGKEAFLEAVQHAMPVSQFMIHYLAKHTDASTVDGKAKIVAMAKPLLDKVNDSFYQTLIAEQFSRQLNVKMDHVYETIKKVPETPKRTTSRHRESATMTPIRRAIALTLQYPNEVRALNIDAGKVRQLSVKGSDVLAALLDTIHRHQQSSTATLLMEWENHPAEPFLQQLILWERPGDKDTVEVEFQDCIKGLIYEVESQKLEDLQKKASHSPLSDTEKAELKRLLYINSQFSSKKVDGQ